MIESPPKEHSAFNMIDEHIGIDHKQTIFTSDRVLPERYLTPKAKAPIFPTKAQKYGTIIEEVIFGDDGVMRVKYRFKRYKDGNLIRQ